MGLCLHHDLVHHLITCDYRQSVVCAVKPHLECNLSGPQDDNKLLAKLKWSTYVGVSLFNSKYIFIYNAVKYFLTLALAV